MANNDLKALQRARDEHASRFIRRSRDGDAGVSELRDLHEQVRLADAALAAGNPRRRKLIIAVLAICTLVSLAAWIPMHEVAFTAEIEADAVTLQMQDSGSLGPQSIQDSIEIEAVDRLQSSNKTLAALQRNGENQPVVLRGSQLQLQGMHWDANSIVRIASGDTIRIEVESARDPAAIGLETAGAVEWRDHARGKWEILQTGLGDTLTATAAPFDEGRPQALIVTLGLGGNDRTYAWDDLRPSHLAFVERSPMRGRTTYASSLLRATLEVPLTKSRTELRSRDRLEIEGLTLERCELIAGRTLTMKLSGKASVLRTSVGGFEQSLKPSLLEWLTRHHMLALLWSAGGFLWGVRGWIQQQW